MESSSPEKSSINFTAFFSYRHLTFNTIAIRINIKEKKIISKYFIIIDEEIFELNNIEFLRSNQRNNLKYPQDQQVPEIK